MRKDVINIKVLHMFTTLDAGGVESFLYNYYMEMKEDIQFDFIVPSNKKGFLEEELVSNGCQIFHVPTLKKSPIKQIKLILNIIKNNNYDIIHCHGYKSFIGLILGYFSNCKVRIMHSHMVYIDEKKYEKIIRFLITKIINVFCTSKFACGVDAGIFLFGRKAFDNKQVTVINNAVDLEKYKFNSKAREKIKKELAIPEDTYIIGNIARLTYQKNQKFLLDISNLIRKNQYNMKILLVGNGEDEKYLKDVINEESLQDIVYMLGKRKDIPDILSAIDLFVLPSRYEGLPVVLAEVQASGLQSIVSNHVTDEVNVTDSILYLPINNANEWFKKIISIKEEKKYNQRLDIMNRMKDSKFDLAKQSRDLLNIYNGLWKRQYENK